MLTFLGSIVPYPPFAGQDLRVVAQAAVHPCDRVAHLEPGILDGARETVPGAGATEREQVTARLEDSQTLLRPLAAGGQRVPLAAHEAEPVRRIGHDRIHGRIGQGSQHVEAVAVVQRDPVALIVNGHDATPTTTGTDVRR